MGSSVKKVTGRALRPLKDANEKLRKGVEKPFRTGGSRQARETKKLGLLQQQREAVRLAESEDEIARRRGLASSGKGGRRSLIKSQSASGLAQSLGG